MNTDQLLDAMAGSDPSPDTVLDMVRRKRRTARNRMMYTAASGLAVVVAVVAGVLVHNATPGATSRSAASSVSGPVAAPAGSGLSSGGHSQADGGDMGSAITPGAACTPGALAQMLAQAVRSGASVIVGSATLTGGPAAGHAAAGSATYYSVTLRSVRTLAGPPVASGAVAWITGASASAAAASAAPAMVAPGGQLFGIVYPAAGSGPPGPVLRATAVIGGQLILSRDGCWDAAAFPASLPQGIALTFGPSPAGHPASTEIPLAAAEKDAQGDG